MLENIKDKLINIFTSRIFVLTMIIMLLFAAITYRLFVLQIINGESYLDNFTLKIERNKTIASTRGTIYDRNGNVLASDKLAYSVTIEDNYDTDDNYNMKLNDTIYKLINIVEKNGDKLNNDFDIIIDADGNYSYTLTGTKQLRFLADIYGRTQIDDLAYKESSATPDEVMSYLCSSKKYGIGKYTLKDDGTYDFTPEEGYSKSEILKIVTVRYSLNLNSYQKYLATVIATNVNESTVAEVMENKDLLQGVDIAEDTVRTYIDDPSFSHILGYTGKISDEELTAYNESISQNAGSNLYELNDMVGKAGIEQYMEKELQGVKGSQTIFVDNLGRVQETGEKVDPIAGNDLYLTIDSDLQKAVYQILEQKIAGILISKIRDVKTYVSTTGSSSDIIIPITDVYYALFDNNFISIASMSEKDAGEYEKQVQALYDEREASILEELRNELSSSNTIYENLSEEMQVYESYIVSMLQNSNVGVFDSSKVDTENDVYKNWKQGKISLSEYLKEAIACGWINTTKLGNSEKYLDSEEIYDSLLNFIINKLSDDLSFSKKIYKYMILNDVISGKQICHIMFEQGKLNDSDGKLAGLDSGEISAYNFILKRIRSLEITPADLALDPCSGSCVVTDVNTGEVLALVSYPSYDNSKLANSIDAAYYSALTVDQSLPLYNYATQQETAPGSTFKPVSATAGLEEGVISPGETIDCVGIFEKITPSPKCWIYPNGTHGNLNVIGAIQNSCNFFFYEVGYRLASLTGRYDSDSGLAIIKKYADLYGLTEKSGIEITESEPEVSTQDAVRSAIGQGNHAYTTVGLSRYVTTVANEGTCFNLSLLDKLTDSDGSLIEDFEPDVRNYVDVSSSTWDNVHEGMRMAVVEDYDAFEDFPITAAGKTGTAQQITTRPNHALFVGFAPYDKPEISIATRIAYGYTSANAAEVSRDVFKYYFKLDDKDNIITGTAVLPDSAEIGD
ncbi:MAG: penicillin-binding protein [Lachnospiraceae bacterium]|nr:penicillin-binding protein [Lachnospiraceae bacterium]